MTRQHKAYTRIEHGKLQQVKGTSSPKLENVLTHSANGVFATGKAVTFRASHRLNFSKKHTLSVDYFQQGIEPHGRYVNLAAPGQRSSKKRGETSQITFANPLVLHVNPKHTNDQHLELHMAGVGGMEAYGKLAVKTLYNAHSWKAVLAGHYGKTGRALSQAIIRDGYDGIVTVDQSGNPSEIVDLTVFKSCTLVMDLAKSVSHERFFTTVMTEQGKVHKIGAGRFGARKVIFDNGIKGTLKPKLHSTETFRGIRRDTEHMREVAAYQLDRKLLHFGVVPPTALTMYDGRPASVQSWVGGMYAKEIVPDVFNRENDEYKELLGQFLAEIDVQKLRKVVLFDLITNNTDRHAKNCLFDPFTNSVWAIDNGLCFGRYYDSYFNVFHKHIFRHHLTLDQSERELLSGISVEQLRSTLGRYLGEREIQETYLRIQWTLEQADLGFVAVSKGNEGKNEFPGRSAWFKGQLKGVVGNKVLASVDAMGKLSTAIA